MLGNHDEHRIVSRVGPAQARVATMLLLTLRGTPTLYYGDEIGMRDVHIPPERVVDPWEKAQPGLGLGRDPERSPMQWDDSPRAGFCPPSIEPWLPIADDYRQVNVAAERTDKTSFLTLTRRLIELRCATPALSTGSYTPVEDIPAGCFVYIRASGGQRYLVALNFSDQEQELHLPEMDSGQVLVSTYLDREEAVELAALRLRRNEGCVIDTPMK